MIKRTFTLIKRNFKEMMREPLSYVFCIGFPIVMITLFQVINRFTNGNTPIFINASLIPGIMVFSFTFVMLTMALLVSKDKQTALIRRLYISPAKPVEFILSYAFCGLVIGIIQAVLCVFTGFIISLIMQNAYFSFGTSVLLVLSQIPMLLICIFLGILFGSLLNDKSAPAVTSIFISASGILGGAWMPLDTMGGFETFCRFLPFYPSVYIGRTITGALHTYPSTPYVFDNVAYLGLIPIGIFLILGITFSVLVFKKQTTNE